MGAKESSFEFKPFHETIVSAVASASTHGVLKCMAGLCKHTHFPNENGVPSQEMAVAIDRRAAQLKVAHRDNYFLDVKHLLEIRQLGKRPFHESLVAAIGQVPNRAESRREAFQQLRALGELIIVTRIPEGREAIHAAFHKKANRIDFCSENSDFCAHVAESLDAQQEADKAEADEYADDEQKAA